MGDRDKFCARCGSPQPGVSGSPGGASTIYNDLFANDRRAALLCYIPWIGWVAAIVVLASERFRRTPRVRFHAFQGLYLFAAWMLVDWIMVPGWFGPGSGTVRLIQSMAKLAIFIAWIFMMIRVSHNDDYHLPVLGELAERSVSEQQP